MLIVNSKCLLAAADEIQRRTHGHPMPFRDLDHPVTASQLRAAARSLQRAEPSIITKGGGAANGVAYERLGFIEDDQPDPKTLLFTVGVLPSTTYRISRRGKMVPTNRGKQQ